MQNDNSTCCLIFSRTPEPGKTKTRLIPALGIDGAYQVHLKLLEYTLYIASKTQDIDFMLYTTSSQNSKVLTDLSVNNNLLILNQTGNNLGERMYHAMRDSLVKYSHCIIIGTDCPEISKKYLTNAKKLLSSGYDAVIGPAFDGGYVLIGLNNSVKELFSDINWGENTVLESTLKKFDLLKLDYIKLPTLHDVDTEDDLRYLALIQNKATNED